MGMVNNMVCLACGSLMVHIGWVGNGSGATCALYGCPICKATKSGEVVYRDFDLSLIASNAPMLYMGSDGIMRPLSVTWREAIDALDFGDEGE